MTSTPTDVSSLAHTLWRWEWGEYVCASLVVVACAGEFAANFTTWLTGGIKEKKDRLEKGSTLLLIAALSFELVCLFRTNQISARVVGSVNQLAVEASTESQKALGDAADAIGKSKAAVAGSNSAEEQSEAAIKSAGQAESLAHGARNEADSFENDIVSAKKQAAVAESHLADALQRAAAASAELKRLESPRSLTGSQGLVSDLSEFKGTVYTFSAVYADGESIGLLQSIDNALQRAGWRRGEPVPGFPAINVFGNVNPPYSVPAGLTNGVQISIGWPGGRLALQSLPGGQLPAPVQAAVRLDIDLFHHIFPAEASVPLVDVEMGKFTGVRISIGKKP